MAVKNLRLNQIATEIGVSGFLRIFNGVQPTNPDTALSGNTMLANLPCSATFAPNASGGVLTANAISTENSADATGTATWASLVTSAGVRMVDMSAGVSAADLIINTTSIVAGAAVSCSSLTITSGN